MPAVTASGMTLDDARNLCRGNITSSATGAACLNLLVNLDLDRHVENCAKDIMVRPSFLYLLLTSWIVLKIILDCFKDNISYHIFDCLQYKNTQFTMEQHYILPILCCQYHACGCPGDLRSQGIRRHGIDQISQIIPSLAKVGLRNWIAVKCNLCTEWFNDLLLGDVFYGILVIGNISTVEALHFFFHLQFTDDRDWAKDSMTSFAFECQNILYRNTSLWVDVNNGSKVPDPSIDGLFCPGLCTFQGICVNGGCMHCLSWCQYLVFIL